MRYCSFNIIGGTLHDVQSVFEKLQGIMDCIIGIYGLFKVKYKSEIIYFTVHRLRYEYHILHYLTCIFINTLNRKIIYKSKIANVNIM